MHGAPDPTRSDDDPASYDCASPPTSPPQVPEFAPFPESGADWRTFLIACAAVLITAAFGRFCLPLALLLFISMLLFALHNAIYIVVARLLGLREVEEVALWLGPALFRGRVHSVLIRVNLLPVGSYVKFPGRSADGIPRGFSLLGPWRQALIAISAPLSFALLGWCICLAFGLADGPLQAIAWLASPEARSLAPWKILLSGFLSGIPSPSGTARALGILMLTNGIINLLPVPVVSGGAAMRFLLEPLLGPKNASFLLNPIGLVGLLLYAALFLIGITTFISVVFARST